MATLATAYMVAVALGAATSVVITILALRNPDHAETKALALLTGGIALWTGGDFASMLVDSREATILVTQTVHYLGVAIVPTTVFLFIIVYTNHDDRLTRRRLAALYAAPAVLYLLALTGTSHSLLWTEIVPSDATPVGYVFENGLGFYAYVLYSYSLLAIGTALLARFIRQSNDLYRGQSTLLMIAAIAPWLSNIVYVLSDSEFEPSSMGFTVAAVALAVAVFRYRLTDLLPIARDAIVEQITDGVVVLDRRGRVVDANPQAAPYLQGDVAAALGRDVTTVLPEEIGDWLATDPLSLTTNESTATPSNQDDETDTGAAPLEPSSDASADDTGSRSASTAVRLTADGTPAYLAVETTALRDGDTRIGQFLIIRDVTDRQRYERELERQNERLDRFASVVSHDLRNPLNVADGYLSILAERYDDPELDEIETSLDRMEHIIEDVLTLARHGDIVSDRSLVDLSVLANRAWNGVDTADATLAVETGDHRVAADESRLSQVFENLFRNAVEHGGPDVTVTVGTIDIDDPPASATERSVAPETGESAGFYVADDGVGIPKDDRDAVLESGYTTNQDGTGLGLDIVGQIVEAHGWSLGVTESADGGARFEIYYDGLEDSPPVDHGDTEHGEPAGDGHDRSGTDDADGASGTTTDTTCDPSPS
ncbi:signal transduction histidine kinase [Halovivax ruber XH-70]|uniref:histidine kinase n=1 Tax=Halovivax ruber (strain DSM 18193 / JCM 13892 / XH-70) TaxID=797302 RepID=L0I8V7_HALRX|nr:histidine kinase N-terminal 7TM domain-containing protein [Halovivax ruber]AGB15144.1 signal transduction histidine kinase [Halovivax ruber XH-70]